MKTTLLAPMYLINLLMTAPIPRTIHAKRAWLSIYDFPDRKQMALGVSQNLTRTHYARIPPSLVFIVVFVMTLGEL